MICRRGAELLERPHDRLIRIAGRIYQEDFHGLHGRHDLESVVSEVWMRLVVALENTVPESVDGFFGLVFLKVRQVLLDMVRAKEKSMHIVWMGRSMRTIPGHWRRSTRPIPPMIRDAWRS